MNRPGIRAVALLAVGVAASGGACRSNLGTTALAVDARPAAPPPDAGAATGTRTADMPRLPEDPEAGRRSEAQWRLHMDHEEYERQIAFDKRKLPEHLVLVARLRAARARLDGARSVATVKRLAAATSGTTTDIRLRIHRLDHWGVNSRLLPDYEAMLKMLDGEYAAARVAALAGDPGRQGELRARWDQHLEIVDDWLTEAKNAEDEP